MERLKQQKLGSAFLAPASVVLAVVAALNGLWILAVLSGLAGLFGATSYVGIWRYKTALEQFYATPIDYTRPSAFAYTLLQTVGLGVVFGGVLYLSLYVDLVAPVSEWFTTTDSLVILSGAVPGLALGVGYPLMMQRQDLVPTLSFGQWVTQLDAALFLTAYAGLLFGSDPLSVVYGVTYVGSRLAILGSIYGRVRPDGSSA